MSASSLSDPEYFIVRLLFGVLVDEDSTTVLLSSPVDSYHMNVPVESWDFYTGRRIQTENYLIFDILTKRSPIHIM